MQFCVASRPNSVTSPSLHGAGPSTAKTHTMIAPGRRVSCVFPSVIQVSREEILEAPSMPAEVITNEEHKGCWTSMLVSLGVETQCVYCSGRIICLGWLWSQSRSNATSPTHICTREALCRRVAFCFSPKDDKTRQNYVGRQARKRPAIKNG